MEVKPRPFVKNNKYDEDVKCRCGEES